MNDWDNFFQLKEGDIIQEGDECLCDDEWEPAKHEIGTPAPDPLKIAHRIYRRRKLKKSDISDDEIMDAIEKLENLKNAMDLEEVQEDLQMVIDLLEKL